MTRIGHPSTCRTLIAAVFVAAGMALSGCSIQLISKYDEATDKAVTALQKKTEAHLVALEAVQGLPDCKYEKHKQFYEEAKVDISAITVRAAAIPKNEITTQQAGLLSDNLGSLEKLHRIACLSGDQIAPLRTQFNSSFTAILKLELAKRRGE
jgi:hypothetical protein